MRRSGPVMIMASILVAAMSVKAQAAQAVNVLDGKVFVGEVGNQGRAKGDRDTFEFQQGTFHSTACDRYGFSAAKYTAVFEGDAITFEAKTTSPKEGTMIWKGVVRGTSLSGTTQWQRPRRKVEEMWFKGDLKSPS